MVVVYKLNFKFYLIGKKGCSLFLLPQWSGLHDQDRLPCRGEVQTNDCIYVREVRRNYLLERSARPILPWNNTSPLKIQWSSLQ